MYNIVKCWHHEINMTNILHYSIKKMFPPSPFISSDMFLLSFAWILFMDAVNPYGFNDGKC